MSLIVSGIRLPFDEPEAAALEKARPQNRQTGTDNNAAVFPDIIE